MTDAYLKFFGLRERPFNSNADPRYMHLTHTMAGTLAELVSGVQDRKGFLVLTGEVGSGKTTLIRRLLDWLAQNQIPTAFIFNSRLDTANLFNLIVSEFGVPLDGAPKGDSLKTLQNWLLARGRSDGTSVLIVDEAQGLSYQVLDDLRLLLDLEARGEKPLQIVLAGQPELDEKLRRPELRQVRQRIAVRCKTAPLTIEETNEYILQRLKVAGAAGEPAFGREAADAVHFYSLGVPRVINLLCDRALAAASREGIKPVPVHAVEEAAAEFEFDELKPRAVSRYSRVSSLPDWMAGDTPMRVGRSRAATAGAAGPVLVAQVAQGYPAEQQYSAAPDASVALANAVLAFSARVGTASITFASETTAAVATAREGSSSKAAVAAEAPAAEVRLQEASVLTLDPAAAPDEIEEITETGTRIEIIPVADAARPSGTPTVVAAADPEPMQAAEIGSQPPEIADTATVAASSANIVEEVAARDVEEPSPSKKQDEVVAPTWPVGPGNGVSLRPAAARRAASGAGTAPESALQPAPRRVVLRSAVVTRRHWVAAPPRRRPQRAPWWWSARDVWDLQESLSAWREGFLSFVRATARNCRELNESMVRWLRAPMGPRHPRSKFLDRQD